MLAHPPELALSASRFESSSMIKQHVEANTEGRRPRFESVLMPMLPQNKSHLLFLPEKPGSAERGSAHQDAIDAGIPHATDHIMITMHISVAEQQRPASPHDLSRSGNGAPVCFSSIHLLQSATMQGNDCRLLHKKMFDPLIHDHNVVAETCFHRQGNRVSGAQAGVFPSLVHPLDRRHSAGLESCSFKGLTGRPIGNPLPGGPHNSLGPIRCSDQARA
jgi:hypothetical protein